MNVINAFTSNVLLMVYFLLCLYVDGMLIIGGNKVVIQQTINIFHSQFDIKDIGLAYVILGIKIQRLLAG